MESVRIRPGAELAEAVHTAFDHHREQVLRLVPDAEVEHVGATSVPGALTKGDLDVLVRVHPSQFSRSVAAMRWRFSAAIRRRPRARRKPLADAR